MRIGITGTIGSGKSEVTNYLRSKGFEVFNCDETNAIILENRSFELLSNDFSDCFENRMLNKKRLADVIFSDSKRRKKLESILHPIILNELLAINNELVFAEVPLLYEVGWDKYFDEVVLVVSDESIALKRLEARGVDYNESKKRILSQLPVEEKIKKATFIIYNNGSLDELHSSIDKYLESIC